MEQITQHLILERSTKNKHLYVAGTEDTIDVVGNVYIAKSAMPEPPPHSIVVTIQEDNS